MQLKMLFFNKTGFQSTTVNQNEKQSKMVVQYSAIFQNKSITLISPRYTFSLAGNIVVYKPSQETNWEKYLKKINYLTTKAQDADSGGK